MANPTNQELLTEFAKLFGEEIDRSIFEALIDPPNTEQEKALDGNLNNQGGFAFLWEDVLAVQDILTAAKSVIKGIPPEEAASLIRKLILFWSKLRGVRVKLTKAEFDILKMVKSGYTTTDQLVQQLNLTADEVLVVVDELKSRRYRDDIPLLKETETGYATDF